MKTKNYLHMLSIVLVGAILFQACEKEDTSTLTDDEITVAEDDALAENLFDEIFGIALAAEQLIDGQIFSGTLKSAVVSDSCPNVSVDHPDSTYWPKVITIESIRTREWVEGSDKWNRWDDVYFITGETTGTNFRGEEYTRTILTPLEWAASCRFIKSGSIEIVVGERDPIIIDFGNGDCDNEATVSRNGETRTIELRYHHRRLVG